MASPFADPRTGQLYFRRAVPEALRAAFDGKAVVKVSLRTKDPAAAKVGFARENAAFETTLADARRRMAEGKSVKTEESKRLLPVHERLIELGFLEYLEALAALGRTELFPDLKENSVGKRTKEASQKLNRIIDSHVSADRRLVFHSLRHAFKAKGNDAGLTDKTLDQICGHAPVSTGSRYGSEPRIRTIHRDLHRIDFSCIDWAGIAAGVQTVRWKKLLTG